MNLEIISAMYRLLFVLNIKAILLTSYSGLVNICFCFISVISDLQQILETKNNLALATVTRTKKISQKKIKHFPQLFALGLQIQLKLKWNHFLKESTVSTKLDIYIYNYKNDNICRGLSQTICLVRIKCLIGFFDWILRP